MTNRRNNWRITSLRSFFFSIFLAEHTSKYCNEAESFLQNSLIVVIVGKILCWNKSYEQFYKNNSINNEAENEQNNILLNNARAEDLVFFLFFFYFLLDQSLGLLWNFVLICLVLENYYFHESLYFSYSYKILTRSAVKRKQHLRV